MGASADTASLPPLWAEGRRGLLVGLVLVGCGQAAVAAGTALILSQGFTHPSTSVRVQSVAGLVALALALGGLRWAERVLAERLGQDYVHQIRGLLTRAALVGGPQPSLGVSLVRNSNDLTSVRNWVALGVAPLAVAVPLVLGAVLVLAVIHPYLALALAVPMLGLCVALGLLSRAAYRRSRTLRRARGRLAGHLADTLTAVPAISAAGGGSRELRRISRRSSAVVETAVSRARTAGSIRGSAAAVAGLALAAVVAACLAAGLGAATLAAAVTVVGLASSPVQDLGRVVEYRQAFRAARRILVGVLGRAEAAEASGPTDRASTEPPDCPRGLAVSGLAIDAAGRLPDLRVPEAARVRVTGSSRGRVQHALATLAGVRRPHGGAVVIDGADLARMGDRDRRVMLGYVAQGMRVERGTVFRAARYRRPDCEPVEVDAVLEQVGLARRVQSLPRGLRTELRRGGEPLDAEERALLLLARALLGTPAVLVLDHVDGDLGARARQRVSELLRGFPGVIAVATDHPEFVSCSESWVLG